MGTPQPGLQHLVGFDDLSIAEDQFARFVEGHRTWSKQSLRRHLFEPADVARLPAAPAEALRDHRRSSPVKVDRAGEGLGVEASGSAAGGVQARRDQGRRIA